MAIKDQDADALAKSISESLCQSICDLDGLEVGLVLDILKNHYGSWTLVLHRLVSMLGKIPPCILMLDLVLCHDCFLELSLHVSSLADQAPWKFPENLWRLVCSIDLIEEAKSMKEVSTRLHVYADNVSDI